MKQSAFLVLFFISFFANSQGETSHFANGDWYKISVLETGIHQITYNDLISYGMDPTAIDPQNIVLFGKPAGMLSETFMESNIPVTEELAIYIEGEDDGVFDPTDYILFYGQSPVTWIYDSLIEQYRHQINFYTDESYYFLSVSESPGKRIPVQESVTTPYTAIIDYFDLLIYHELDIVNPGKQGKQWLGESFQDENGLSFEFDLSNYVIEPSLTYFNTGLAAKSTEISSYDIMINDGQYNDIEIFGMPESQPFWIYRETNFDTIGFTVDEELNILFTYNKPNDSALAWLDFFEFRLKSAPYLMTDQLSFRTAENVGEDSVSYFYFIDDFLGELEVWNVTDPMNVTTIALQDNGNNHIWYQLETVELMEFQAFNGLSYLEPSFIEKIENQDLLGLPTPKYLIITHPDFAAEAELLKIFHENDLSTTVVSTESVYHQFSSGAGDISAIRNFIWYLYHNTDEDTLKYVALLGDASYDYKDRIEDNTNFVPTYETWESNHDFSSFATDHYFAVKDMYSENQEQIAVGRIPVSSNEEATAMISKFERYTSENSLGNWKNEMMFIGDDGDQNLHMHQAEILIESPSESSPVFNINKTYLDFFELIQSDEGPRYPEVNAEIKDIMNDGVFYVNYTGHGGKSSLAQEQVVTIPEIGQWSNEDMMPLWVIGSADVARYDDPSFVSLAESLFLKEDGGAVTVISTSGGNFSSANLMLNKQIIDRFTDESEQQSLRFGDLFNIPFQGNNDLKWIFLGDPALKIGFPEFGVQTLTANDIDIAIFEDTISPGETIDITGQIVSKEDEAIQAWFNGNIYLKIYAPEYVKTTLGNQGTDSEEYLVQDSVLVMSDAIVEDGSFEISVTMPANYYEGFGNLKLSWYAENGETDANGFNNQLIFGGLPTDIDEFELIADKIKAYPSPFKDKLTIDLPQSGEFTISVYDMMGVRLYSEMPNSSTGKRQINLSSLSNGIYLVNVSNQLGAKNFKVLKH